MSRTLFLYVFKDLLRIFLLTAGALAGIMSFGGLLRPLTEHGLDASQVGKVLTYFMPAMMTYSLPISALFATTVVYGRLAADNELTACRAAGISHLSISSPAMVLGLTVAIVSLLFLCFVVPSFSLKVERVIYSNLARLIANEIETTRQIRHDEHTIYAQRAVVQPMDPKRPREQMVTLEGVMIVSYDKVASSRTKMQVPGEFYLARSATILIHRGGRADDEYSVEVLLEDGSLFPRTRAGKTQAGMKATRFGPVPIDSPIKEDTKFMDIRKLHELSEDPTRSQEIRRELLKLIREDQASAYLREVLASLSGKTRLHRFKAGDEIFELMHVGDTPPRLERGALMLRGARWVEERADGTVKSEADVDEVKITARATPEGRMAVVVELHGANIRSGETLIGRQSVQRPFNVPMSPAIQAMADRSVADYLQGSYADAMAAGRGMLLRQRLHLGNAIHSEMHSRASFAVSCLILVMVGAALGMMFKSGNFLTAFAISVVPALMCIALIVTGSNVAASIPRGSLDNFQNPLNAGLALIWSGNAIVLVMAVGLMWRLQRQ
ncbi:MAG TPA: LptF/LptG family permease [Tepidisphaeraceae bacterium]|nr:LptF/LptG family permease [Tepidisphaeraceae bacterium]